MMIDFSLTDEQKALRELEPLFVQSGNSGPELATVQRARPLA
jgi:hypothetical protein